MPREARAKKSRIKNSFMKTLSFSLLCFVAIRLRRFLPTFFVKLSRWCCTRHHPQPARMQKDVAHTVDFANPNLGALFDSSLPAKVHREAFNELRALFEQALHSLLARNVVCLPVSRGLP